MNHFDYRIEENTGGCLGLIVLQADETVERDFRRMLPGEVTLHVSRVASGLDVSEQTLLAMEKQLPSAVALFPLAARFDAVGYGCTSGTSVIGAGRVAELINSRTETRAVTEPVSALSAACLALGLRRLAMLSPYVEGVSQRLRKVLNEKQIETPVFGSFDEAEEARVARIAPSSIRDAAVRLADKENVDAVFLSCTNLRTLDIITEIEGVTGKPVLSSNQVLGWHMLELAGLHRPRSGLGRLFAANRVAGTS